MSKIQRIVEEASDPPLILDEENPMRSARMLAARNFIVDGVRVLHRHRGGFWLWTGSYYLLFEDEAITSNIWILLEKALQLAKRKTVPFQPTRAKVGEVVAALKAVCKLDDQIEPPTWLSLRTMPAASELFACGNGLLHLPTGKLYPTSADFFNVCASEVVFDPNAPQPTQWRNFLDQLFGKDTQAIELLQEWFGYVLSPDTSQQKILTLIGPIRCGKGTIGRLLRELLGSASTCGPTISSLGTDFGLEPMITKSLSIISDMRIGERTDKTTIIERLLSISGEDPLTVPRKFKQAWHGRLPPRIMILTNEEPSLADASGAFASRLLLLILKQSFYGKEDPTLLGKLVKELPGILNWSIVGYRRLHDRGHFIQPESSLESQNKIEMLGAPVKAFIRDCCNLGPGLEVPIDALWGLWVDWCRKQGRKNVGVKSWFGRNLRAAAPGVADKKPGPGESGDRERVYVGIGISDAKKAAIEKERQDAENDGLALWERTDPRERTEK